MRKEKDEDDAEKGGKKVETRQEAKEKAENEKYIERERERERERGEKSTKKKKRKQAEDKWVVHRKTNAWSTLAAQGPLRRVRRRRQVRNPGSLGGRERGHSPGHVTKTKLPTMRNKYSVFASVRARPTKKERSMRRFMRAT